VEDSVPFSFGDDVLLVIEMEFKPNLVYVFFYLLDRTNLHTESESSPNFVRGPIDLGMESVE
jgi:hypothetical protein